MGQLDGLKSVEELEVSEKVVFLRLDLNVPLDAGRITDETRIIAALPTIKYLLEKKSRLVLASHLGRPKTDGDRKTLSLEPVAQRLNELLNTEVILVEEPSSEAPKELIKGLTGGQVILLENLRFDPDETKNEPGLAAAISKYTEVYVNDAFGASHRAHASIVGVPAMVPQKGIGFLMKKEVEMLEAILEHYESPFVTILGGSKVSDKIDLIENLIEKVDCFVIGGAMAYTFLISQGVEVGKSLVEKDKIKYAGDLVKRIAARDKRILLPLDHLAVSSFDDPASVLITGDQDIPEGMMAVDIGPKTMGIFGNEILRAKTIFWNGPMGVFEIKEYSHGSFKVAECISMSQAKSIVGGGDSAAAANMSGFADKMTHISTGGGASLEFLQGKPLPGLVALKKI